MSDSTPKKEYRAEWEPVFLETLAQNCNVKAACASAGIERSTAYKRRKADNDFAESWDDAIDDGVDALAAEARRRAAEGTRRGIWHQGVRVGEEIEYSDTLIIFLLKAHRPEVYRDNYDVAKNVDNISKR